jgi:two-component system OmpR family response regulator
MNRRVLVIEDNADIGRLIELQLAAINCDVHWVADGLAGLAEAERGSYELVVLDLMLPGMDGLEICRRLSARETRVPILMLTAKSSELDRVLGLELGADDYLTKPFSPRELLARIRALLRRSRMHESVAERVAHIRAYRFGGWELNLRVRRLARESGEVVPLRNGEFNLLLGFLASPRRALPRGQLLDLSRLHNAEVYDRSVDVLVGRLRKKIERDPRNPQFILTERGIGYVFNSDVECVRG